MSFFDECACNLEQQNAYRMIANTNNSFFLTGKAGTGKSTFLRHICQEVKKRFVVLAPTGVAAMNVGGQTIHSFFGLSFGVQGPNNYGSIDKDRIELLNKIDTIIIDEVSMVRCDMVDVIDRMLRRHRNDPHPFGGVQVVFVGDLFQLPPVINMADKALLRKFYKSTGYYFYDSNVLSNVKLPKIEFTKVYRQNDPAFIELLDRFRVGAVQPSDIVKLNTRVVDEDLIGIDESFRITLTTRKDDAALINENRLAEIGVKSFSYTATYFGDCSKIKDAAEDNLVLKVGAQVMFIRNIRRNGCVNGTIGVVSELSEDIIKVKLENGTVCEVETEVWEAFEYQYNESAKVVEKKVIGKMTQYPLRLAWAITIHKSQSLTFDKVAINFGKGAFTYGQTYVALSRARSFAGIELMQHINQNSVMVSRDILSFAKEYNDEKIISTELEIGEAISQYETTKDYDSLATTLCQIAEKAIKANDISYAYDLVSRALQNIADDTCLMNHLSWPIVSNDNRESVFLNAVRYLYSGHSLDAQRLLENFLIFNPEHFGAIYLLARAYELQGNTEKLKDTLDDMARIIKKAMDNGMDSTAFRKFYYRRAILHSELCGTADGITLLKLLIKENPRYDKYHIAVRNILRKYKKYLQTEISENNTIVSSILNDDILENEFLEKLHKEIAENSIAWRLYRRSLSDLEFEMTEEEYDRLVKDLDNVEFID
ncbi:MAG: AAA family ATPase [Bacteroidales bacterium]|nr:AAA family ATPase [Bacteroidales bacterium]